MPSQYFLGPRHFGTPFTVHVNSSSKLSSQSSVPSQIWSFSIHFPPNSHLYWSTVQSCAKIGARRQHSKTVKFKYCRRAMMSLWFTEIKTTTVCWLQIKPVFSPGITQPLLKKFEGSGAPASAAPGQPPQFILFDHFCVKEAKKLMKLDYIIINLMFAHPNLAWFLRPALLHYIHLLNMLCMSAQKYVFLGVLVNMNLAAVDWGLLKVLKGWVISKYCWAIGRSFEFSNRFAANFRIQQ